MARCGCLRFLRSLPTSRWWRTSLVYNAFHTYLAPITLGAVGVWLGMTTLVWVALVWVTHIGADRAVGYGLKYATGFKHTHLSSDPSRSISAGTPTEIVPDAAGTGDD